jgi:hypothetical protein
MCIRAIALGGVTMKGFLMSVETAERFYRLCHLWKLTTEEERMALMNKLLHEEDIKILSDEKLKKMLEGKKVLGISRKESQ